MTPASTALLARYGFAAARIETLPGDAGFRRYCRLHGGPRPALLLHAPPDREDLGGFLRVAGLLAGAGLSVPEIIAADPGAGYALIEDFGTSLYAETLTTANITAYYDAATDALRALQTIPPPADLPAWDVPAWDGAAMAAAAAATFLDWWWPAAFGTPPSARVRAEFMAALAALLAPLDAVPPVLVHRDYFAGNLFWLAPREGVRRVGIIDFQDAARGHPGYDLVSLIEDARRDLPADLAAREIARFLAARPEIEPAPFRAACIALAAVRHVRVAGLWVRLAQRDAKPGYLQHGPRTWARLAATLARPEAAPLAAFFARNIPPELRCNPALAAA
jgi:aminoglycoside/choline kinase family phosphotransferase